MSIAHFLAHLAESGPAFRCYACDDDSESLEFLAHVSNQLGPPASASDLSKIDELLVGNAAPFKELYRHCNGFVLYADERSDAAGLRFYPVSKWQKRSARMRRDFREMGWEADELPEWLNRGIAFGEIPDSGNSFVVEPSGPEGGAIYYADHDDLEEDPVADGLEGFLREVWTAPADFLYSYGCYTRYSDGKSHTQWIPKEYLRTL